MNIKKYLRISQKICWSIYFLFISTLALKDVVDMPSKEIIIDFMVCLPSLAGLLIYIFRWKMLVMEFWKVYFFVFLTWSLYRNIILQWILIPLDIRQVFLFILLFAPLYYSLYKISFSAKSPLLEA